MKSFLIVFLLTFTTVNFAQSKDSNLPKKQIAKHIILLGSDGFGAYAFKKAKIPNIRKLMKGGAYSLHARSVLPSSSAVNWASMIMGSGPELHGYTEWNSKTPEIPSRIIGKNGIYPTIFSVIDKQMPNAKKGAAYHWNGIKYLFENDIVDLNYHGSTANETLEEALKFIIKEKPVFTFIHLDQPDGAGHKYGHDTPEYYKAVEKIDDLVGKLITGLKKNNLLEDTIIIFTADHGGINKGHGGKTLLEVEIPWIIYGKNILPLGEMDKSIVTYDTAATIAYLLGLEIPDFWRGKPVTEVVGNE